MNKHERLNRDSRRLLDDIHFAGKPTLSAALMMQRFGRYNKHLKAVDEWYSEFHKAIWEKWLSCYLFHNIKDGLDAAKSYTLPTFTLRDHLKDCYGWLTEARP